MSDKTPKIASNWAEAASFPIGRKRASEPLKNAILAILLSVPISFLAFHNEIHTHFSQIGVLFSLSIAAVAYFGTHVVRAKIFVNKTMRWVQLAAFEIVFWVCFPSIKMTVFVLLIFFLRMFFLVFPGAESQNSRKSLKYYFFIDVLSNRNSLFLGHTIAALLVSWILLLCVRIFPKSAPNIFIAPFFAITFLSLYAALAASTRKTSASAVSCAKN